MVLEVVILLLSIFMTGLVVWLVATKFYDNKIFVLKEEASKKLEKDEFLIQDLIGCAVFNTENEKIGTVTNISTNSSQDLLNIKNLIGQEFLVPFVKEFFPDVDIKNKKITIKPIEGLIS